MPKAKPNVGSDLAHARFRKGLTLDQLAKESGVSVKTVTNIEKGLVEPYGHTIYKLAGVLGIDPEGLFVDDAPTAEATA